MDRIQCPFCLSLIAARAHVCRYCARDVRQLLDASLRIRELESLLPPPVDEPAPQKFRVDGVVWSFYAAATLLYWYGTYHLNPLINHALVVVSLVSGVALAFLARSYNPVRFFIIGFAQPVLSNIFLVLVDAISVSIALSVAPALLTLAFRTGLLVTVGGVLATLVAQTGRTPPAVLDLRATGWLSVRDSDLARLEKIILMLATISTPLISIISLWRGKP